MPTKIWDATDRINLRPDTAIAVDQSSTSTAGKITGNHLIDELKHAVPNKRLAAAFAGYLAGSNDIRILCVGDSTTFGGKSNNADTGDFKALSYPTTLSKIFELEGYNSHYDTVIGKGNGSTDSIGFDNRLTGTGVGISDAFTIGGGAFKVETGDSFTFTPDKAVDTFKIYAMTITGSGTFSYEIDSEGSASQSLNAADSLLTPITVTTTGSLGTHTLTITHSSGGTCYIMGIEGYDSSKNWINVMNAGSPSSKSADWDVTGKPWHPDSSWTYFNPDVVLLSLGINDWIAGDPVATYKTNMQTIITGIIAANLDVMLVTPPPSTLSSYPIQTDYVTAMHELAEENNISLIDIYARFISRESAAPLGMYYSDAVHPIGKGYAHMAKGLFESIRKI